MTAGMRKRVRIQLITRSTATAAINVMRGSRIPSVCRTTRTNRSVSPRSIASTEIEFWGWISWGRSKGRPSA